MQSTRPSPQPSRPGVSCSITVSTADAVKTHQGYFPTTFDAAMWAADQLGAQPGRVSVVATGVRP